MYISKSLFNAVIYTHTYVYTLQQCCPIEFLQRWKRSVSVLSKTVTSHISYWELVMWLVWLRKCYSFLILFTNSFNEANLNSYMWVAIVQHSPIGIRSLSKKSTAIVNIMRTVYATLVYPGSQGEWTEMRLCKKWWLHCTSQWGVVEATEWACVLCGHCIQNDWVSRARNLCQILC